MNRCMRDIDQSPFSLNCPGEETRANLTKSMHYSGLESYPRQHDQPSPERAREDKGETPVGAFDPQDWPSVNVMSRHN